MQSSQPANLIFISLLAIFWAPVLYLVVWGVQNDKLEDWKESLGRVARALSRFMSRHLNRVINQEEDSRRSTKIFTLKLRTKNRASSMRKGTKVLI